jgi:cation diffusion facilitator family transporter
MVGRSREIRRVLLYTFLLNEAVAAAKITWGYLSNSLGMMSDGVHSMFDGVSNIVGMVGIYIASHPPDRDHPYGHRKFETLFTIIVGLMILGTCYQILKHVYLSLGDGRETRVSATSFVVMAVTIGVNLFVMRYEMRKGKELGSEFLTADALHTKSNLMASAAVLVGLALTGAGYPLADALVGLVIAAFIARLGVEIIRDASNVLTDKVCLDTTAIERVACSVQGVRGCHAIRTRGTELHVCLDLHIQLAPHIPLTEAHDITHSVQGRLKEAFPSVVDIVVHTEPDKGEHA